MPALRLGPEWMLASALIMRIDDLLTLLRAHGARPPHEEAMLRAWLAGKPLDSGRRAPETFFPSSLRRALGEITRQVGALAQIRTHQSSSDGTVRLLVGLSDGRSIESVLLSRDVLCASTQVGCAVACRFCMTGQGGLTRHLGSAEIAAQVALARSLRTVRKVVFMGMGEPAHNLDNVLEAIELLGTLGDIGHKSLVFSTVGDLRAFERLPQGRVKPALALSLHTTKADLRARLLPRAPRIHPTELVERAQAYADATAYPVQYQWTLLEGVNDGDDEVDAIARLLAGKYAVMNFIPFNDVDGLGFRRPAQDRALTMTRMLNQRGVLAKLRQSGGQDIDAACGQLRSRSISIESGHDAATVATAP
jgi:23S rRNA (adenine2503-C2)-methyltransferase